MRADEPPDDRRFALLDTQPGMLLRGALALLFVAGAVFYAWVGLYLVLVVSGGGCEDYGIACREGNPAAGIVAGVFAALGVVALLLLAGSVLLPSSPRAASLRLPAGVALAISVPMFVAVLALAG